jgi:hypothetical protein
MPGSCHLHDSLMATSGTPIGMSEGVEDRIHKILPLRRLVNTVAAHVQ